MLIKCPECGRENVSDTAATCPDCGYEIKTYFEKIRQKEIQEAKYKEAQQKHMEDVAARATAVHVPTKRPSMNIYLYGSILCGIFTIISIIVQFWLGMLFLAVATWVYYSLGMDKLKARQKIYDMHKQDTEQYQKQIILLQDSEKAQVEAIRNYKNLNLTNAKCPICGSSNIKKISTINKVVSTEMLGLASNKIGKQWHCNSCKSDF